MKYKTFRLFVSSTFNDFKEEREVLHDEVLPQLKDFCNERGYDFQMIDLRWGIYSEATLNHKTLPICIDEVKRCKEFSPRPNFLAMVGERYGWIPLPPFIAQEEFVHITEQLDEREQATLKEWYLYDANEIDGQFYLCARSGSYIDDLLWANKESELRTLLIKGAEKAAFDEVDLKKYTASATEHEIINGLFADQTTADSSVAFFRTGYPGKDTDGSRINSLKQQILDYMQATDTAENLIELSYDDGYKTKFSKHITDLLLKLIAREMERIEELENEQTREHRLLPYYNGKGFSLCHEQALATIEEYVSGQSSGTLFLTGESGCGKTTLLAKFLSNYHGKSTFVFYGENALSCSISNAIEYALEYEIKSKDGGEKPRKVEDVYANADYDWYIKKTQFERESNIYACLSLRSKLHMMGLDYVAESVGTPKAIDEKEYLERYAGQDEPCRPGKTDIDGKKIVEYNLDFKESRRKTMAIHEHLRWNSFMITKGFVPSSKEEIKGENNGKNYHLRKHGNLTTFEGLEEFRKIVAKQRQKDELNVDVIKYDYQLLDDAYWLLTKHHYKVVKREE